jgi:hypothetical protein
MQETTVYEVTNLRQVQNKLDQLIADGYRIVQMIHHTVPRTVPYTADHITVLVIYEQVGGTTW